MAHLKRSATHLLKNATGHLITECGGNPCDPDPEMLLTVTGATGTITWCNQTWTLPADSGVEKSVCPTLYLKNHSTSVASFPPPGIAYKARHVWTHAGSPHGTKSLQMRRAYYFRNFPNYGFLSNRGWNQFLWARNARDIQVFRVSSSGHLLPPTPYTVYAATYNVGLLTGHAAPFYSAYNLTDNFFGSYVTGGITYTWQKGGGW